jgi:hypothetical protein
VRLRPPSKEASPKAAQERHKLVMQQALACISDAVWTVGKAVRGPERTYVLMPSTRGPVRLRTEDGPSLYLGASQHFRHITDGGNWRCHTLAYDYTVFSESRQELFAWHWHPASRPGPHVHVNADGAESLPTLRKLHLPTERVAFEQIVRFLLQDVCVKPRSNDWSQRLEEAEYFFRTYRSWPGGQPEPETPKG